MAIRNWDISDDAAARQAWLARARFPEVQRPHAAASKGRLPLRRLLEMASSKFAARARLEIAFESDGFRLAVESDGGFYASRFVLGGV